MIRGQRLGEHVVPSVAGGVVEVHKNARDTFHSGRNAGPWGAKEPHRCKHRHVHTEKSRKVPVNVASRLNNMLILVPGLVEV